MIARSRSRIWALVLGLPAFVAGCERVPLLAPTGSTIILSTVESSVPMNGAIQIQAQVLEPSGTPPHSGTHVSFTTTLGSIQPSEAETDINGRATVVFRAGNVSGFAQIIASSGGVTTGTNGSLVLAIGAAAVGRIVLSANPARVPASGGPSIITATVQDQLGNLLTGIPVAFSTDAGTLSAALVVSDQNGTATTTLTTNTTAKVTASAGIQSTTSGTTTTTSPVSQTITVNVNVASTLTVGAPSPAAPVEGQAVTFSITYTQNPNGSPAARIVVDYGDGSPTQTLPGLPSAITHTFDRAGTYTVRVTVIDTFGDTSSGSNSVTIAAKPQITVDITPPANPVAGAAVTFVIKATPTTGSAITSIVVDFGDGVTANLQGNATSVSHVYSGAGTYTVSATATDSNGNRGSGSTVIVVTASAGAVISSSASGGVHPVTITFNGSGSSMPSTISSYQWDFGDPGSGANNTASTSSTSHTYNNAGTYVVTLTVTDSAGRTSTTQKTITVT